jgi:lipopolysaccharide export system protein LptA
MYKAAIKVQNPSRQTIAAAALACLMAATPMIARALSSDKRQPIRITADRVTIDEQHGVSVYKGHVVVDQGTLHVTADQLTLYTKNQVLQRLVATGQPATYRQRPDGKPADVHARARRMEYFANQDRVVLTGDAQLRQAGNTFTSKRIVYDLKHDRVAAGNGGNRVEIVIQPRTAPAKP